MMNAIQQVGFIGLGDQGAPMARAITRCIWPRRPESYRSLSGVRHLAAGSRQFATLCNNALTVPKLRNVEVFAMTDNVGTNLRAA
ncbi:hypothetical protein SAMN04515648_2550 [Phyllobacterium sp. CL33Tsu]|nr:hypothetical protein SAMN04515648_2550 [Phyllobacterium sp. CL33Tsu]